MKYFSKNKKWMAYLILLTFLFTSIMPSNLGSMNSVAEAADSVAGVIQFPKSETDISEPKTDKNETQNLTDSDLRRMMRDPKYWRDNDVEYIRKIENGFKKLYSK